MIRVGVHGVVGEHATVYPPHEPVSDVYLQTLDAAGTWIALSLSEVIKEILDVPDGYQFSAEHFKQKSASFLMHRVMRTLL